MAGRAKAERENSDRKQREREAITLLLLMATILSRKMRVVVYAGIIMGFICMNV